MSLVTDPVELERDRAVLEMAQIGLEQTRDALDQKAEMARAGLIPLDSVPGATDDINRARSMLDETLDVTQEAEQKLNEANQSSEEALKVLESELAESTIVKMASQRLKQAKILAPVSGEISERYRNR